MDASGEHRVFTIRHLYRLPRMTAKATETMPDWLVALNQCSDALQDQWIAIRRHLHQHPELSDSEYRTTEFLREALGELGLQTHVPGDGRGVTADLISSPMVASGPRIAIRGDIDALPIHDDKAAPYHSLCPGVMHACGHDVHAAVIVGAMQLLTMMDQKHQLPWPIAARAILQPSEELATGAQYMIHHHALRDIEMILGLHVDPTRPVGCIGLRYGALTAACDLVTVTFSGKGGHGARPHLTHDPIDACTHWVQTAFRRVARTTDPHKTIVFSIGKINAGHSANVIPDHAELSGTLRSLDLASRNLAIETLEDVCEAIQQESGCEVSMQLGVTAPMVDNDKTSVDLLVNAISDTIGGGSIQWIDQPSMGSEDFSYYLKHVPGAMFRLGVAGEQVGNASLHTSGFDIDENAISIGCKIMAASVINHFAPI